VVPLVPPGQKKIAGSDIGVGAEHLDVRATHDRNVLSVTVDAAVSLVITLR